jgi:hypothetical protein
LHPEATKRIADHLSRAEIPLSDDDRIRIGNNPIVTNRLSSRRIVHDKHRKRGVGLAEFSVQLDRWFWVGTGPVKHKEIDGGQLP